MAWWCLDDWGQLARAANIISSEFLIPARWLSQHFYWTATWPLFGLDAVPHAFIRILLHGFSAALVARISKKAGLASTPSLVSGLLFAASPVSFTALYWASGIQELLGGALALLAVDRWMADGRKNALLATMFGILSILSKENGIGLPAFLMVLLVWTGRGVRRRPFFRWVMVFVLALSGFLEGILIWRNFPTGLADSYAIGGLFVILGNAGKFGWWFLTQGPVFTGQVTWTLAVIGLVFFALWASLSFLALRKGRGLPAATLLAAMLSLAPALVLVHQARPYMGYLAMACLSISIGFVWPRGWKAGVIPKTALVIAAVSWGIWGMTFRAGNLSADGLPADPIVRAMARSRTWSQYIQGELHQPASGNSETVVVLQQPLRAEDIARAQELGENFVLETPPHLILGGPPGLALLTGSGKKAFWLNSLTGVPSGAFVFCETSGGFKSWGSTRDALLYASLLDILVGNFQRARSQLRLAAQMDNRFDLFPFDPEILRLPMPAFRNRSGKFMEEYLVPGSGESAMESENTTDLQLFLVLLKQIREAE